MTATEDATKKAGACWVAFDGGPPRLLWHLWHDGALWLVVGGLEQEAPTTATSAVVTVRGAVWSGSVRTATASEWGQVVPLLHDQRLNPPDGEQQPQRWARESTLLRISPRPAP